MNHLPKKIEKTQKVRFFVMYLSPILMRGFLHALPGIFILRASPSFSVTTHSFTLPASNRPMKVAFVLCNDITFSKRIQKTIKWTDLPHPMVLMLIFRYIYQIWNAKMMMLKTGTFRVEDKALLILITSIRWLQHKVRKDLVPWSANSIEKGYYGWDIDRTPLWYFNLRNQDRRGDNNAVKHKRHNVCYDLAHKEEVVDDMDFLPKCHFLHQGKSITC